ncbi:hypothetical protein D3C79_858360 [compost metagenome]
MPRAYAASAAKNRSILAFRRPGQRAECKWVSRVEEILCDGEWGRWRWLDRLLSVK